MVNMLSSRLRGTAFSCVHIRRTLSPVRLPVSPPGRANRIVSCRMLLAGVEFGKLLAEMGDLGRVVVNNVRIAGMVGRVVLMVSLRSIEALQRRHLRDDR